MTLAEDGVENTPTTTQEPGIDADHEEALHGKAAANEEAKGHWQLDPAAVVALVSRFIFIAASTSLCLCHTAQEPSFFF